jgi:hypothetical protein
MGWDVERAHDVIGLLPLCHVVADEVSTVPKLDLAKEFGIESAPEQEEVPDMPMDLSFPLERVCGETDVALRSHLRDRDERGTLRILDREDLVGVEKAKKEMTDVVDNLLVKGFAEIRFESVLHNFTK